jgi:hypothetical protein
MIVFVAQLYWSLLSACSFLVVSHCVCLSNFVMHRVNLLLTDVHSSGLLQQHTLHAAQLPNVYSCRTCTLLHTSGSDPAAAFGGSMAFEWV